MGNALLDFVMRLVRDPEAAAQFASDPVGALSAADLSGVTPADVHNLMPVVADSIAMSTPRFPELEGGLESAPATSPDMVNVWTSGAATAAFAAFDHHPVVLAESVDPASFELPHHEPAVLPDVPVQPAWPDSPWPLDEPQSFGGQHSLHHDADPGHAGFDVV